MTVSEGERWGNYLLEERVGAGGMAEVFRARRVGAAAFRRLVCVKRLHPHLSGDPVFVQLFLDEAGTGARLRHRNIVGIEDLGEHGGQYFLAMEYVNGVDLAALEARLRGAGRACPVDAAAFIAGELLSALHAAHTAVDPDDGQPLRVVHRDVSPHNVLVSYAGEVKLTDFGIARATRRVSVTTGAVVRGRFGYMPVEQASGRELDARADLFALGVVLFELLTGRRPFRGEDPDAPLEAILVAQLTNERPALASLRADVPPPLLTVVEWLLATEVERRPPSAAAALAVLEALPARLAGGAALNALLCELYPARASAAYAPRASLPPGLTAAPSYAPPALAPAPAPSYAPPASAVDPYARTPASFAPPAGGVAAIAPAPGSVAPLAPSASTPSPRVPARARASRVALVATPLALLVAGGALYVAARPSVERLASAPVVTRAPAPRASAPLATTLLPALATPAPSALVASAPLPRALEAPPARHAAAHTTPRPASSSAAPERRAAGTPAAPSAPAPPAAPSDAPPAAPPALGTLRVLAVPWGDVFIDDAPRGRAPVTERLNPGEHSVRITGGVEHRERVRVLAGRSVLVRAGEVE